MAKDIENLTGADKTDFDALIVAIVEAAGIGGGDPHVVLTQSAYDALVTKDPDTFYFITE